jgi:prepilin-type N-terminal cleavage/methylation domain-containing protein
MNRKAFTLIELLVVVAIIGILAAVGVVAYNGYTYSAKVNSSKAQHAIIVKYISSELMKCNFQDKIFDNTYDCSYRFNPSTNGRAPTLVLSKLWGSGTSNPKFKHPNGTWSAVTGTVPNYFVRYARGSCGGSTGNQFEFSSRMENSTTEVEVWTCINSNTADRLVTKIPLE